jgi:ADP-ribose pyrophosphatase
MLARLQFYHGVFGLHPQTVTLPNGMAMAFAGTGASALWSAAEWRARWAALVTATAQDVMALRGQMEPDRIAARHWLMMVRGASRLRATGGRAELRRDAAASDVSVAARRHPYANYFSVEEYDLHYRRFDDQMSGQVNRAVFISGDAVTVLPYDPLRDRVLLIEQFRVGPFARGDDQPWLLEAIAGRIDPGETPQDAARREAVEEAGLALGELLPIAAYYPTPGAKAEFLYSYVALCDLPDGITGTFGMAEEAEDIRGHLVSFDQLMHLVDTGEAANAPLVLSALWLARERARLRG